MSDDAHSIYKKRWDADKAKWEADSAKLAMFDELVGALDVAAKTTQSPNLSRVWDSMVSRARKLQQP